MKRRLGYQMTGMLLALSLSLCGCNFTDRVEVRNETQAADPAESGIADPEKSEGNKSGWDAAEKDTQGSKNNKKTEGYLTQQDAFTENDKMTEISTKDAAVIAFSDAGISCTDRKVTIEENCARITQKGTYIIEGTCSDGMLWIETGDDDKVTLVLNGLSLENPTGACIYVKNSKKVFLYLMPQTENLLTNGGSYALLDENNIDAVIFSKDDLTLGGEGSLIIRASAGHGIVSKDKLKITGGIYRIAAQKKGLSSNDRIAVSDGDIRIEQATEGMESKQIYLAGGTIDITCLDDGLNATDKALKKEGRTDFGEFPGNGDFGGEAGQKPEVDSGQRPNRGGFDKGSGKKPEGGKKPENGNPEGESGQMPEGGFPGMPGNGDFDGDFGQMPEGGFPGMPGNGDFGMKPGQMPGGMGVGMFDAQEDVWIQIDGGMLRIAADGDGIDSNGDLLIRGGTVVINGSESDMDSALDYNGTAVITGGTVLALGSRGMAQNFGEDSTQGAFLTNVGTQQAGTTVEIRDAEGKILFTETAQKRFDCLVFSSRELTDTGSYTIVCGEKETSLSMSGRITGKGMEIGFGRQNQGRIQ